MARMLAVLAATAFVAGAAVECGLGYPLQHTWSDTPPHVHPSSCALRVLPRPHLQACLANRTLYILGNSIARNYQAELAEMVGGATPFVPVESWLRRRARRAALRSEQHAAAAPAGRRRKRPRDAGSLAAARERLRQRRQDQKVLCGRGCTTTCAGGFRVKYARVQYFGAWPKGFPRFGDVCGKRGTSAACLRRFFADSKPGDMVLVLVGLMYAITPILERRVANMWPAEALQARVERDISTLPRVLADVFKGGGPESVYFVTTPPTTPGKWVRANAFVHWLNPTAVRLLGQGPGGAGFHVLDQYGIAAPHYAGPLYNDFVHMAGPLTQAALHLLTNNIPSCMAAWPPEGGSADNGAPQPPHTGRASAAGHQR